MAVIRPLISRSQTSETATPVSAADLQHAIGRVERQGVHRPHEPFRGLARHAYAAICAVGLEVLAAEPPLFVAMTWLRM